MGRNLISGASGLWFSSCLDESCGLCQSLDEFIIKIFLFLGFLGFCFFGSLTLLIDFLIFGMKIEEKLKKKFVKFHIFAFSS